MDQSKEAVRRLAASTLMPGFAGATVPAWLKEEYAAGLAAVCLYGANVVAPQQFSDLCGELRGLGEDLVVALDEEGGDVTRLHYLTGSPEPGNAVLGRLDDPDLTQESAARIGAELAALGVTLDLGPVVDVNSTPQNPVIGVRSFGADPALVARHSAAWVQGLQSTGVAACAKHFPGHGDTVADSHLSRPVVEAPREVLDERELVPFRAVVDAGVAAVMTSHVVVLALDPDRVATFSPDILTGLLRDRLGYRGVIVSDALDMAGASGETGIPAAAVRALAAGCDLLCVGADTTHEQYRSVVAAVVRAVEDGSLDVERVADAASRARSLGATPKVGRPAATGRPTPTSRRTPAVQLTTATLQRAFDVSRAGRDWLTRPEPVAIVQADTDANLAVGGVPWGPRSVGAAVPADAVPSGAKVAVVGRGIGPDHPARHLASRLRRQGRPVILVDCGWPTAPADVVTFGGSPPVAAALVDLLTGREPGAGAGR